MQAIEKTILITGCSSGIGYASAHYLRDRGWRVFASCRMAEDCARLIEEGRGVIATGGGAFVDAETRALILDKAIAAWIDCDIDILVERTSRRDTRPLLKNGDPREILTNLYETREPFYRQSQVRVESCNGAHADTAHAIIEAIDKWL